MLVLIYQVVSAGSREMATVVLIVMALIAVECLIFHFSFIFQCEYEPPLCMVRFSLLTISAENPLCTGLYL
jgi:hypothetical protein